MSKQSKQPSSITQNDIYQKLQNLANTKQTIIEALHTGPTQEVVVMAIRLSPSSGATNFRRNPFFNLEFQLFSKELIKVIKRQKLQFQSHQHSNIIFIIMSATEETISRSYELTSMLASLVDEINTRLLELNIITLSLAISIDLGETSFADENILAKFWLYELLDRTQTLVSYANTEAYPGLLITHKFYQHLSSILQEQFPKAYYIKHIACYGRQLASCLQANKQIEKNN